MSDRETTCIFCFGPAKAYSMGTWYVQCSDVERCGAVGPFKRTAAEAIAAWHRPALAARHTMRQSAANIANQRDEHDGTPVYADGPEIAAEILALPDKE